jgi:hypothetical protein
MLAAEPKTSREDDIRNWDGEFTMAVKCIYAAFRTPRRRRKEIIRWLNNNPSPRTAKERLRNILSAVGN